MSKISEAKSYVNSLALDPKNIEITRMIYEFHNESFYHAINAAMIAAQVCDMEKFRPIDKHFIVTAALVHDVGMITVPQYLLHKKGQLEPEEYAIIKSHVTKGVDLLQSEGYPEQVQRIILEHHERNDGSGYPNKLTRDQISDGGRLLAVVDSYEAITAKKCYGKQYNPYDAVTIMLGEGNYEFNYIMDIVKTSLKGNLSDMWKKYVIKNSKPINLSLPTQLQNQL